MIPGKVFWKRGIFCQMYSERSWRDPGGQRYFYPPYQSRTGQTFRNPGLNAAGNQVYIQVKNYCSQQHASQDITSEPMSKGAYHIKFLLMWQLLFVFPFLNMYFS